MYAADARDRIFPLAGLPQSSVGTTLPCVMASESRLLLAYIADTPDSSWDGTSVRMVGSETQECWAIVRIVRPYAQMFGPPNDEAFAGHPLASRGLEPYGAFEVVNSSWIRSLERMNSAHPHHNPVTFLAKHRHFILSFHDSTFECVARSVELVETRRMSMRETVRWMADQLEE